MWTQPKETTSILLYKWNSHKITQGQHFTWANPGYLQIYVTCWETVEAGHSRCRQHRLPACERAATKLSCLLGSLFCCELYIYIKRKTKKKQNQQKIISKVQFIRSSPHRIFFFYPDSSVLWRAVSKRCSFVERIHWKVGSCKNIWTPCGRDLRVNNFNWHTRKVTVSTFASTKFAALLLGPVAEN